MNKILSSIYRRFIREQKWICTIACCAVVVFAVSIRLIGAADQTRIFWDEGRPEIERVIENPVQTYTGMASRSWGRPGLVTMKLLALGLDKVLFYPWSPEQGFSLMPIRFQIVLDIFNMFIMAILVVVASSWLGEAERAIRFKRGVIAAMVWALSPVLVRYSHRMLAPVYVLPLLLFSLVLLVTATSFSIRNYIVWLCIGFTFGMTFSIYPGSYQVLLFSPLLVCFDKEISAKQFFVRCCMIFMGGLLCLTIWQGVTLIGVQQAETQGLTYYNQLIGLSGSISQGDYNEVPIYLFRFLLAHADYIMVLFVVLSVAGLISRLMQKEIKQALFPLWCVLVYMLWCTNGPLLRREVLYGRVVVLLFPLIILAGSLSIPRWLLRRYFPLLCSSLLVAGMFGIWQVVIQPPYQTTNDSIAKMISEKEGIAPSEIRIIGQWNDYGRRHTVERFQDLQSELSSVSEDPYLFVALNQRAISHPAVPFTLYQDVPMLSLPSPIRHPWNRFEGHGLEERRHISAFPQLYDIKVFSVRDFVQVDIETVGSVDEFAGDTLSGITLGKP